VIYLQSDFIAISAAYERLVNKEDELHQKAKTCQTIIDLVINDLLLSGESYHLMTVETLLNSLQSVQEEIIIELSLVHIQKGISAFILKQARDMGN